MSEDFISGLQADLVEAMDRYERRSPHGRLAAGRYPQLLRPATLARVAAGAAIIVALVAAALTVARNWDVERSAAPGKQVVTLGSTGLRFSLDGRVLTVQLVRNRPNPIETVSGARISATCGTKRAAPPGAPRSETTLTRLWPAGQTSLSYRFPRDVSSWCRLDDQTPSLVAFVRVPSASPGARGPIAETANKWARHFASSPQTCTDYMSRTACEQSKECEPGLSIPACRAKARQWAAEHRGATVQKIAIGGDRAAATISNQGRELGTVQLRRTATGEWLIDKLGEDGLTAELRRKLRGPGG